MFYFAGAFSCELPDHGAEAWRRHYVPALQLRPEDPDLDALGA
jgi:hypothetical protein